MAGIDSGFAHLADKPFPGGIGADLGYREHTKGSSDSCSQELRDIVNYDMQLAVITDIQQAAQSAFISSQSVIAVQPKKYSRSYASQAD
jgi:hypothetical protein